MLMKCTVIQTKKSEISSTCQGNQPGVNTLVSRTRGP